MTKTLLVLFGVLAAGLVYLLLHPAVSIDHGMPRDTREPAALKAALNQYQATYGHYPSGSALAQIAALRGDNPRKMYFLDPDNAFIDPWGTAYRIEIDGGNVEVSSAGPDRRFGTADDRTTRKTPRQKRRRE